MSRELGPHEHRWLNEVHSGPRTECGYPGCIRDINAENLARAEAEAQYERLNARFEGLKLRDGDQPLPVINDAPDIQTQVVADIAERRQVGISRYGTALQPHNGRDALRDLYEELLDAVMYVKQVMVERGDAPTEQDIMAALNNEGAYCGDCDFESGLGCADCSRVLAGYAKAILSLFGGTTR